MILESIKNQYKDDIHEDHLKKAKEILGKFMEEHCVSLIRPYNPDVTLKIDANLVNIIAPLDKIENLDEIPEDIIKLLAEHFFYKEKFFDLDLNLSTHLNSDYFRCNVLNLYNSPNARIRKFYIDLLLYNYRKGYL